MTSEHPIVLITLKKQSLNFSGRDKIFRGLEHDLKASDFNLSHRMSYMASEIIFDDYGIIFVLKSRTQKRGLKSSNVAQEFDDNWMDYLK